MSNAEPEGALALDIEVVLQGGVDSIVPLAEIHHAAFVTLVRLDVLACHVGIDIVDEERIHELNLKFRSKDKPTDVLSFPMDGEAIAKNGAPAETAEPLELGDVVICPVHTENMIEATIHGVLHLCGFDHEVDKGEMLELQDEIFASIK
jgi:probable rRNA maturation factor